MANSKSIHVDKILTNLSLAFDAQNFVGNVFLPRFPVAKQSDLFWKVDFDRESIRESDDTLDEFGEAKNVSQEYTKGNYDCEGHGLREFVSAQQMANADDFNPMVDAAKLVLEKVLMNREIDAKVVLDAGLPNTTVANEWDDYTNSKPFDDMDIAINAIEEATGKKPNVMAMDSKVWRAVRRHPDIIDRVVHGGKNDRPAEVGATAFAALFDLDKVVVTAAQQNVSKQGQGPSLSRIWGVDAYIGYVDPSPGKRKLTLGWRFEWKPFTGAADGFRVHTFSQGGKDGEFVQADCFYDQKLVLPTAGYRLIGLLTP